MFRADDQNREDKKFKITNNCFHEIYNSNYKKQCTRGMDRNGEEEMKITLKKMTSKETPDSTVANHDLFCPSQQIREVEKTRVIENCSTKRNDLQDEVTKTIPFRNSFPGDVYQCKYCTEEYKVKDTLISPCRCSGSLGYVHKHCLENWITVRSEGSSESKLRCELCRYRIYHQKHKRTSCSELKQSDRWLYSVGIICMFVVIGCFSALILCFVPDSPFTTNDLKTKIDQLVASSANTNEIKRTMETYSLSTLNNIKVVCLVFFIVFAAFCLFLTKLCKVPPHKFIFRHVQSNEWRTALTYTASRDSLVICNATSV